MSNIRLILTSPFIVRTALSLVRLSCMSLSLLPEHIFSFWRMFETLFSYWFLTHTSLLEYVCLYHKCIFETFGTSSMFMHGNFRAFGVMPKFKVLKVLAIWDNALIQLLEFITVSITGCNKSGKTAFISVTLVSGPNNAWFIDVSTGISCSKYTASSANSFLVIYRLAISCRSGIFRNFHNF